MNAKLSIIAIVLIAMCASGLMATDLEPYTGQSTNVTFSITNTVGKEYIISGVLWGVFSTDSVMEITPFGADRAFIFAKSSTATNALTYIDGSAGLLWDRLDVITLTAGGDTTATNYYRIQPTTKPRP